MKDWPLVLIFASLLAIVFFGIWAELESGNLSSNKPKDVIPANLCQELHLLSEKITTLDESYKETSPADWRYKLAGLRTRYHRTEDFLKKNYPNIECPHANN